MKIIIAPDSFKGSLSAIAAVKAIECGMKRIFPTADFIKMPIADGGEGTLDTLVYATGGSIEKTKVMSPIGGTVEARWGILGDGKTAIIEMAEALGLTLVEAAKRDINKATTYGTGQLMRAALEKNLHKIIVAIGGSATNDGGSGMAQALGAKFLDENGESIAFGGAALISLANVDLSKFDRRIEQVEVVVACDVANPLCGENGASAVYGPQKGATTDDVRNLDCALGHYADIMTRVTGKDFRNSDGAGAAGGLGAGLLWFTGARMKRGISLVMETLNFAEKIKEADLVITGEGRTDKQTLCGKAPIGIAEIAKAYHIPVVCISGALGKGYEEIFKGGIDGVQAIPHQPMQLEDCMKNAEVLLTLAAERVARLIKIGRELK